MRERTVLVEDSTGREKLEVSLPGGRYQLSLDNSAVNLLCDDLGLGLGDVVPEAFVPVLVATRDAWFPHQRDTAAVVDALPAGDGLTDRQREALVEYLTSVRVNPRDASLVEAVVAASPVADEVDPDDLTVASLPEIPDDVDLGGGAGPESAEQGSAATPDSRPQDAADETASEDTSLRAIPGVGDERADALVAGGYTSVAQVAESRPADVAETTRLDEGLATVAVEGAREVLGHDRPTSERLAAKTGVAADEFEGTLSALAASGVPPSEAAPVLELLYGPAVAEIDAVSGQQAYYLWEAGYRTPGDVAAAEPSELQEVPYVGANTAPRIIDGARALVEQSDS